MLRQLRIRQRDPTASEQEILSREPPRDAAMDMIIDAWSTLGTCRQFGMVTGPIPYTAVLAWCGEEQLDDDMRRLVVAVLKRLDRDFMDRQQSRV